VGRGSGEIVLGARLIFPVEGPPIRDGRLTIRDGLIAGLSGLKGPKPDLDLGDVAITPGFVNAHTHLELEALDGPPAQGPEDEIEWLGRVISQRRNKGRAELTETAQANVAAALAHGTTLIADTTTAGASWPAIAEAPLRATVFAEVIGLKRQRGLETNHAAWEWLGNLKADEQVVANARPGISPHAPYSTAGWLYHRSVGSRYPLSTHLAEMPEELELLSERKGRLRGFLEGLGAWDDDWEPISPHPADYVRKGELREADWLIAHGNYLTEDVFWQLRPEAAPGGYRVAVAYCPRTHARFGHVRHPFREMLRRGVVVCLGTDSLASSPSLSILDEMRYLRRIDRGLGGALLLTMGTLFGAWALKAETVTGSLKLGKSADLAVVALNGRNGPDPYSLLLDGEGDVVATCLEGRFVSGEPNWIRATANMELRPPDTG
jgi:aminodeoxyfutalosine deaminase